MTVNTAEDAAFGTALLAGVGAGNWADVNSACESVIKVTGSTLPESNQIPVYRQTYTIYRDLFRALKEYNVRINKPLETLG